MQIICGMASLGFLAAQQEYIRSLIIENEKLREHVLDQLINQQTCL